MAIALRQSTASQEVPLGPFLDTADGNSEETGITLSAAEILVWKTGATALVAKNSGNATHMQNGIFYAVFDATDTDTLGPLVLFCKDSAALWVRVECVVLPANVYDSMFSTDLLDVNVAQWLGTAVAAPTTAGVPEVDVTFFDGTAITATAGRPEVNTTHAAGTAWGSGAITAASIASDAITAAKIAANAITSSELADGAITAAKFAASAIDATAIASNAITSAKIATGAITAATFAAGAIDAAAIAADAIGASELAAGAVDEILDDPLTDSVPADGALPTVRQALYMICQFLMERSVSGTTVTVRKVDGSTSLMTLTINDATTPTAITRAT